MLKSLATTLFACAVTAFCLSAEGGAARAQNAPEAAPLLSKDYILLTIFLKHDESKPLGEINKELEQRNWMRDFPPAGVEVESWYVMMGIGQVVTLRVPPEKVREVNRMIEQRAWGPYRTEFYLTYDYKASAKAAHEKAQQAK
ncbi:MAG: hypothetical protein WBX25_07840 [Rhodomicrobium sp.]